MDPNISQWFVSFPYLLLTSGLLIEDTLLPRGFAPAIAGGRIHQVHAHQGWDQGGGAQRACTGKSHLEGPLNGWKDDETDVVLKRYRRVTLCYFFWFWADFWFYTYISWWFWNVTGYLLSWSRTSSLLLPMMGCSKTMVHDDQYDWGRFWSNQQDENGWNNNWQKHSFFLSKNNKTLIKDVFTI